MKIICIGRNYVEHAKELQNEVPSEPVIFIKPKTALAHPHLQIHYPEFTDDLQFEAEVVLKISKNGKFIKERAARQYFDQWTIGIDFTARDVQTRLKAKGLPWELAKAFDGSAAVGQFVPVPDGPLTHYDFALQVNDKTVQQGNTGQMIFSFEKIISYASKYFTLQIGDLIFTGTPAGVGPVLPYDQLNGFLDGEHLLNVEII